MVLELLTPHSADVPVLVTIPILSTIVPQLAAEVIDEEIILGPVIGPHAMIVEALLNQFFTYMKNVVPLLVQDTDAYEDTMTGLEGLANSTRFFDATLAERLKQLFDRLRV